MIDYDMQTRFKCGLVFSIRARFFDLFIFFSLPVWILLLFFFFPRLRLRVFPSCSGFLAHFESLFVRLIEDSKLPHV